jgi:glyoxylate reductase
MAKRNARPRVIVTRELPDAVMDRMEALFDTVNNRSDTPMTRDELAAAMAECDVLVPTVTDMIDGDLIDGAGDRLRLIASFGNGVDHIDLKAARARSIIVTNTPGVLTEDTADMAMALILALPRRLAEGERLARSGEWTGWRPGGMLGNRVGGKTLGILGMGRIGQAVAARARAFGLGVHYHNRHRLPQVLEAQLGAVWQPDLDQMLAQIDVLTIHTPHTPQTEHLIDARRLSLMKPTAYLVNTARAQVIDETALIDALERHAIAGAAIDVYWNEPHIDPRLLALPNVILMPHTASSTYEARMATGEKVMANIRMWADGHRPPDQVLEGWV